MPDLGVYWIAVVWCWIVIPHFIPGIGEHTQEVFYVQLGGLALLIITGTMSMPEGHEHHMDASGWLTIFGLGIFIYILNKLAYGKG